MSYQADILGTHINILSGFAFKSNDFVDSGIPVIKIKNITPPNVSMDDLSYVLDDVIPSKYILNYDDVLIAMTGSHINQMASVVGRVARVKCSEKTALNQRVGKITVIDPDDCDLDYVYYYLSQEKVKIELANKAGGAANQANISPTDIKNLEIPFPNINIQRKISSVLRAYDDLIENNQKQIKLLEEAAQRLYKEWFVDLRFPGHENTKITDGVPEGWRMAVLSEIASVNKESISKQYPYDYVDYIDIGAVSKGQINSVTRLSTKDAPGRAKRIAFDGDVLWGMVRPNLKSYALVFHPKETSVFSTGFAILHAEKVPFSFLYCHVTQDEFVSYLINCTNGAAYPAVKPSHFENAVLLVPTDMVLSKFHSLVGQMFRQAEILEQKNQQAIEARDRLLPKLMSGEIEV